MLFLKTIFINQKKLIRFIQLFTLIPSSFSFRLIFVQVKKKKIMKITIIVKFEKKIQIIVIITSFRNEVNIRVIAKGGSSSALPSLFAFGFLDSTLSLLLLSSSL